ncbi:unnamed protein product [Arabidopsis halleri]
MALLTPSLTNLDLTNIPSLVELPSSFQNLNELELLRITNCINLETLPTNCRALSHARWDDSSSAMAMAGDSLHSNKLLVPDEFRLFMDNCFPKVEFRFTNCPNLDQEALVQQQSVFFRSMNDFTFKFKGWGIRLFEDCLKTNLVSRTLFHVFVKLMTTIRLMRMKNVEALM